MNDALKILLAHGSGGKLSHDLISNTILPVLSNPSLNRLNDSAIITIGTEKIAFTTDSYVVDPIFFPGGDIGRLAVCGTVNDLSMVGAIPLFLSLGIIMEEGFPITDFEKILNSIQETAVEARVTVVTGDTKIVPRGKADKIYINTAGIGRIPEGITIGGECARPGDKILINGTMGDHGISVLSKREGLQFEMPIVSDVAPLNELVHELLSAGINIHVLRDPTRGGIVSSLTEITSQSNIGIQLFEDALPIHPGVRAACELLGMEPLYIANEGKFIAIIEPHDETQTLNIMYSHPLGKNAAVIGEVISEPKGKVLLKTNFGTARLLDLFMGEQLPRIC